MSSCAIALSCSCCCWATSSFMTRLINTLWRFLGWQSIYDACCRLRRCLVNLLIYILLIIFIIDRKRHLRILLSVNLILQVKHILHLDLVLLVLHFNVGTGVFESRDFLLVLVRTTLVSELIMDSELLRRTLSII